MDTLDLRLPASWQQLTQPQLRYAYALLASGQFSPDEAKARCLLRWAGLAPAPAATWLPAPGGSVRLRRGRRLLLLRRQDLAAALAHLDWMDAPPDEPLRLEAWHGRRALSPLIREADFGTYLQLENLFQGFLLSRDPRALDHMARILYPEPTPAPRRRRNSQPEGQEKAVLRYSVLNWYAALKRRFAREWPDLFRPAPAGGQGQAPPDMAATMNAELRALTGGDVTREQAVRAVGCWRALEELNAKAREAAEFNKK